MKSDVMMHLSKNAGWSGYLPIIFSLEMSRNLLRNRLIASVGGFNRMKMRDPNKGLDERQKKMWPQALQRASEANIEIFDGAGQTTAEIRAKIRKLVNQTKMKPVVFIDYLTLIKPANPDSDNTHQNVGQISKDLKSIAKEFDCPVVSLAQLSRKVEARPDKRPMLSDLRESGSIEEDADTVFFLYRDSYYTGDDTDRNLEIIVAKNRNGPTGMALSLYNKHTGEMIDP
ncbi:DnaB-like helicase C-terminal domain-containing protein [Bhargavaea ginsengi]|uniref:DnaB-like helicase C-terminal domain-containing protein n=1 Tax=Bhargavaea ginsengi TaxID=426757 RepID=UPI003C792068